MERRSLCGTDLKVSPICLGTVNYGSSMGEKACFAQLDLFLSLGGNFIDTAHVYGDWIPGLKSPSEQIIGRWFEKSKRRHDVVLATKGEHPLLTSMEVPRVKPEDIEKDLKESLGFLKTDYIDLYFLHRDDTRIPVGDIIERLEVAVKAGLIRYYGCSNWSLGRIKKAHEHARRNGCKGFVVNQAMLSLADVNHYNLADKTLVPIDADTLDWHKKNHMSIMAYMSIAKAYFTRRMKGEMLPVSIASLYDNPSNELIYSLGATEISKGKYNFMDFAFMYMMSERDIPIVPIASFDNAEQLSTGLACWNKEIPEQLMERFRSIKQYVFY